MKHRGSLAVDRMTDRQLWDRLTSELRYLASDFPRAHEPGSPAYGIRLAQACAVELRMRGTQTALPIDGGRRVSPHYKEGTCC